MLTIIPKSIHIRVAGKVHLVFVTPTARKYTDIVYRMVSVLLIIMDTVLPRKESGPKVLNISRVIPVAAEDERGKYTTY